MDEFVEVESRGILVHEPEDHPVLLLSWPGSGRVVPVWIGAAEAAYLAAREAGMTQNRPCAQDVIVEMAESTGNSIDRAEVTGFHEGVYIAALVLSDGGRVDCRVSDAVAVCEIAEAPLVFAREILEATSVPAGSLFDGAAHDGEEEEESVEEFARFLDEIDAADFLGESGGADGSGESGGSGEPGGSGGSGESDGSGGAGPS
ncbi:bifunctional nuclease family protein [Corynebacterium hansenii]|uniref:Bifunctional nuclease family protein n=1 Tax=Corynebacterium hansenii TaxID=394964 RepID=A0ABV7ZUS3_9CORY|nr:bifunctional nuclease domain-containing protein [Corynebacterium hansenii]